MNKKKHSSIDAGCAFSIFWRGSVAALGRKTAARNPFSWAENENED
ncbi:hypothetical protein [Brevibacillus agri]|nr:hypothetical protein [Brevibacillus agri]